MPNRFRFDSSRSQRRSDNGCSQEKMSPGDSALRIIQPCRSMFPALRMAGPSFSKNTTSHRHPTEHDPSSYDSYTTFSITDYKTQPAFLPTLPVPVLPWWSFRNPLGCRPAVPFVPGADSNSVYSL